MILKLPTVLSMMSSTSDDLLRIHIRYPLLAFLLSLCNPSTISESLTTLTTHNTPVLQPDEKKRTLGYMRVAGVQSWHFGLRGSPWEALVKKTMEVALHLAVVGIISLQLREVFIVGLAGVVVFSCYSWFHPLIWVLFGGVIHIRNVICWRLCLGPTERSSRSTLRVRLTWCLADSLADVKLAHPYWARFKTLFFEVVSLMDYAYGTVTLSSMSLISSRQAVVIVCILGFSALSARLIAILLLEVLTDEHGTQNAHKQKAHNDGAKPLLQVKSAQELDIELAELRLNRRAFTNPRYGADRHV